MRVIKTYVLRAGRMGPGQTRAFEQFGPQFLVPYSTERLDASATFGRSAPLILEIGFGMGDATAKICLLYTSPSPRDTERSRMPSSA